MGSLYLTMKADHLICTARRTLHRRDYDRLVLTLAEWAKGTIGKRHAEYQLIMDVERSDAGLAEDFRVYLDHADRIHAARTCRKPSFSVFKLDHSIKKARRATGQR